jgi:hypothetical protein
MDTTKETGKYSQDPFFVRILSLNDEKLSVDYCSIAEGVEIAEDKILINCARKVNVDDRMLVSITDLSDVDTEELTANLRIVEVEEMGLFNNRCLCEVEVQEVYQNN